MAVRRKIGQMADLYLRYYLQNKAAEQENERVRLRQVELAEMGDEQETLRQLMGDPTGRIAESLMAGGRTQARGVPIRSFMPPPERLAGEVSSDITKITDRAALPRDIELEGLLAAKPGGGTNLAKDPRAIENLMNVRNARKEGIDLADAFKMDQKFAEARGTAYNTGMGTEQAAAETFEPQLKREMLKFKSMTPLMAQRAGAESGARESASIAARLAKSKELIDFEVQKAAALIPVKMNELEGQEYVKRLAGLKQTLATAGPKVGLLRDLWNKAEPKIKQSILLDYGGQAGAQILDRAAPYAAMDADVRMYYQGVEAALPYLAKLTGEVGNLADQEQIRQRFSLPTALDVLQGTAQEKFANLEAFLIAGPEILSVSHSKEFQSLPAVDRLRTIEGIVEQHKQEILGSNEEDLVSSWRNEQGGQ